MGALENVIEKFHEDPQLSESWINVVTTLLQLLNVSVDDLKRFNESELFAIADFVSKNPQKHAI